MSTWRSATVRVRSRAKCAQQKPPAYRADGNDNHIKHNRANEVGQEVSVGEID